jgi:hypothetical protein
MMTRQKQISSERVCSKDVVPNSRNNSTNTRLKRNVQHCHIVPIVKENEPALELSPRPMSCPEKAIAVASLIAPRTGSMWVSLN